MRKLRNLSQMKGRDKAIAREVRLCAYFYMLGRRGPVVPHSIVVHVPQELALAGVSPGCAVYGLLFCLGHFILQTSYLQSLSLPLWVVFGSWPKCVMF